MPDLAGAYADARASMIKIVRDLSPEQLEARVPACPDWSVKDLIAHVTSIAASLTSGEFPRGLNPALMWEPETTETREEFVGSQVEKRRGRSIDAIIAEWEEAAVLIEATIRGERPWPEGSPPLSEWIVTTDVGVHHHDLRGAMEMPGERDSLATGLSLRSYIEAMRYRSAMEKLPPFKIRAGSREWAIGDGEPLATVTADPFELARAVNGRRSPEQIRAYEWDGDPEPFMHLFFPYGPRADALVE
jgi:uncharacterized protein (TIGR03083 family)